MEKIKLITDSASDIPDADLKQLQIDMLSIPIAVDGMSFYERQSFTIPEFYTILGRAKEIPVTSRISQQTYLECYEKNYLLGYTTLVNVTISGTGSGTVVSAMMARDEFFEQNPDAKDRFQIHILDSLTYSVGYGYAVMEAAKMALNGISTADILAFLNAWILHVDIFLGCYTLKYAQKSGRIHAAAAFIGEVLGMRPIINMKDGSTTTAAKVRGDNKVVQGIFEQYRAHYSKNDIAVIVAGENMAPAKELQTLFKKEFKKEVPIYPAGACIAINAGPNIVALACCPSKALPHTF